MKTSFWTPYISDHTINAICWTLIHSLWIGLATALLAGLTISVTRKSTATLRYNLLCSILVLFVSSVWITFWIEMGTSVIEQGHFRVGQIINAPDNHMMIIPATTAPHLSLFSRVVWLLNEYSNIIFLVWLLLFVLKSLKMAGGLLYIQRIRNYKVHEVADEFKHKIEVFSSQIGIRQTVRLVQSELVKVPVAVGWLKPMILLPMGILLQLSTEQLESILWHELAHIRRRDYLVNILHGLVETAFFFNPGLLWLSSLIRAEREACCDDMVLSRMHRKANYLEALLAFGNEGNSHMPLAMSIGSGNQLRDRLKRMVNKENKRLSMAEKVVLIAGLVALSAFTGLPKTTQNAVKRLVNVMINKPAAAAVVKKPVVVDSIMKKPVVVHHTLQSMVSDTTVKKIDTNIRFTSVLFNKADSDLANCEMRAKDDKGNIYNMIVADNKLTSLEINGFKVKDTELAGYQYMVGYIDGVIAQKRRIMAEDMAGFKALSPNAKFKMQGFDKKRYVDSIRMKPFNGKFKLYKGSPKPFIENQKLYNLQRDDFKPFPKAMAMKPGVMRKLMLQDSANYAAEQARANGVIADLVAEKVVANAAAVKWFGLSDTELIVNGQKQSEALQQKLKAKYGVHENYGLYYGPVEMTGTGVFINNDARVKFQKLNLKQMKLKQQQFAAQDMRLKLQQPQKSWSQAAEFSMQQRNLAKLDMQQKGFFKTSIQLNDIISSVTDDLVSENVIKDKSDLASFKLTNRFLTVNGKKQSDEIYEKLKNKYLSEPTFQLDRQIANDPNFGVHYDAKTGSRGIGIDIEKNDP